MPETATETVWHGAEELRGLLVPIADLEPFPGNPRRGDVEQLRGSLQRFGQVLPALADPELAEGGRVRIVARHHLALAAAAEGWTHIAVVRHRFADEEEARAYLIADNRLGQLGGYDDAELAEHLRLLRELDALHGTGYTDTDVDDHLAALRRLTDDAGGGASQITPGGDGKREHRDPAMKELVLLYSAEQLDQVDLWAQIVAKERGTGGISETVYAALEVAARTLNG